MGHHKADRLKVRAFVTLSALVGIGGAARPARADDATVVVAVPERQRDPEPDPIARAPRPAVADDALVARDPELRRAPFRLALGPAGITTGKGLGFGVGIAADFGNGSVGGRLAASWLRGEGTSGGASAATGDAFGHYTGEITIDLHKSGPLHPIVAIGGGFVHVSRPDHRSGLAGVGTGRVALEYALGLEDADVRIGASVIAGATGPADDEIKDLRAYAITGLHLGIGF
jgi:hypothetical protein